MGKIVIYEDSFKALTDMRLLQFQPVKAGATAPLMAVLAAATDEVLGILQDKPNINESGRVMIIGRSEAVVDGSGTAIVNGDLLGPNAAGTALVKKTTHDFNVMAKALGAATTSGAVIDVFLWGGSREAPVFAG